MIGAAMTSVPVERPITIRDLLTRTSGIAYGSAFVGPFPGRQLWEEAGFIDWYFAEHDEPIRELVAQMAELPQPLQPGEAWRYGYNADILGAIVEVASGGSKMRSAMNRSSGMPEGHPGLGASSAGAAPITPPTGSIRSRT